MNIAGSLAVHTYLCVCMAGFPILINKGKSFERSFQKYNLTFFSIDKFSCYTNNGGIVISFSSFGSFIKLNFYIKIGIMLTQ